MQAIEAIETSTPDTRRAYHYDLERLGPGRIRQESCKPHRGLSLALVYFFDNMSLLPLLRLVCWDTKCHCWNSRKYCTSSLTAMRIRSATSGPHYSQSFSKSGSGRDGLRIISSSGADSFTMRTRTALEAGLAMGKK